jgi:hypothetical protein
MCAKVTGPLYSLSASGTIGKAMVHFGWKGLNVVREWLKPSNPKLPDQGDVRIVFGGLGQASRCAGLADDTHTDSPFAADAKICNPSGQTWVSYLVQYLIKNVMPDATAYEAIYTAFEAHAQKSIFTAQAALLELADFDVSYKGTAHVFSKGMQLYMLGKYGIAMLALKENVFNRAPYLTAIGDWAAGDPVLLKTDLLAVVI